MNTPVQGRADAAMVLGQVLDADFAELTRIVLLRLANLGPSD